MRIFLRDEQVTLRPIEEADIDQGYIDWFDDEEVCQGNNHHRFPYSHKDLTLYIEKVNQDNRSLVLAIVDGVSQEHIGNIALTEIDYINSSAVLSIIIGKKEGWSKGIGYHACTLIIQHTFMNLNIRRISLGTFESNKGMRKLAEKLGFTQEGIRKEALYKQGTYIDLYEYGLLKRDWVETY